MSWQAYYQPVDQELEPVEGTVAKPVRELEPCDLESECYDSLEAYVHTAGFDSYEAEDICDTLCFVVFDYSVGSRNYYFCRWVA